MLKAEATPDKPLFLVPLSWGAGRPAHLSTRVKSDTRVEIELVEDQLPE